MDNKQVQEMLFDTMQKVKKAFDQAAEEKNMIEVCNFSEALTKLAHEIVEMQGTGNITKMLSELSDMMKKVQEEKEKDVTDLIGIGIGI